MPIITLTTDFGTDSPYVAQMKGVLLDRLPDATLVDITHAIPPQDIATARIVLGDSVSWFPAGTVHVAVIDPGVGTERRILAGRVGDGLFVGPDNGIFSNCSPRDVVAVVNPKHWRSDVSHTFHGRDIMAPVAAALAAGVPLAELGQPADDWIRSCAPEPIERPEETVGCVITADSFGNLVTNLTESETHSGGEVRVDGKPVPRVDTYGQSPAGTVVALIGSSGRLEIAIVNGNALRELGRDHEVSIRRT